MEVEVLPAQELKPLPAPEELTFSRHFTDHMLTWEWSASNGWQKPKVGPYGSLSLDPAACVLHYGFQAFEGLKAYKDTQGAVRLFRPDKNIRRLNESATRLGLPAVDVDGMVELLKIFAQIEARWIMPYVLASV